MTLLSRRNVLAAGAGVAILPMAHAAQTSARRIDIHHHMIPPEWARSHPDLIGDAHGVNGHDWTPALSIEDMDKHGIAAAMLSLSHPGVWFGDVQESRKLARICNEYAATMMRDYPKRFGGFASIALPDVEGSLKEIEYAFDVLKLHGVGLVSSYDGKYPGDPDFAPIFDELNRRKAPVFFHSRPAQCCADIIKGVRPQTVEMGFDTTRAVVSLLFNGTLHRCPDVKFIFAHGAGTTPYLADRISRIAAGDTKTHPYMPNGALPELQKLYYDLAGATNRVSVAAMRELVGPSQILFGSDYPYLTYETAEKGLAQVNFNPDMLRAVERSSALKLFPEFA